MNRVTRSFDWFREANPVLPDQQNPVSRALGARVFILLRGGVATPGGRLQVREPWITQARGPALTVLLIMSTSLVCFQSSHRHCRWVGGGLRDGKTSSTRISVTHIWQMKFNQVVLKMKHRPCAYIGSFCGSFNLIGQFAKINGIWFKFVYFYCFFRTCESNMIKSRNTQSWQCWHFCVRLNLKIL